MSGLDAAEPTERQASTEDEAARKQMRDSARSLRHIGEARLMAVIAAAVRHAVKRTFDDVDDASLVHVAGIAQRGFLHLLKNNGKSVRGLPVSDFVKEVAEERRKILAQREAARRELDRVVAELDGRRREMDTEREEFIRAKRVDGAVLDESMVSRLDELFESLGDSPEVQSLRQAVTDIALDSVQQERGKAVQGKLEEHDAEVANYQRRIEKLTQSLSRTEDEIKRLASMKDVETGVASIYRSVQGLTGDDDDIEQKKEMMAAIFEANLELREKVA